MEHGDLLLFSFSLLATALQNKMHADRTRSSFLMRE